LLNISIGAELSPVYLLVTFIETFEFEVILRAKADPLGDILGHALEL